MPAGQLKARLLMFRQGEGCRAIALEIVALLASVQVRSPGKLSLMLILVTVHALGELDAIESVLPFRNMALRALHRGVFQDQRVGGGSVFLHSEGGGLESLYVVTGGALALVRPLDELPGVLVLVAVETVLERQRPLEVAAGMATQAVHRLVFPFQWILGLRVVETFVYRLQRNPLPAGRVVAGLAGLLRETAMMRIGVAVGAGVECQADIARLIIRPRRMALRARNLGVKPAQRITRLVVVELGDVLPVFKVVALLAVLSEAAAVFILVAVNAIRGYPQEGAGLVTHLNGEKLCVRNVIGSMAAIARQPRMLAEQVITGLGVIEAGGRWRPLHDGEVFPIVLGVTARAFLAGVSPQSVGGMQAAAGPEPGGNLAMTFEALKRASGAQLVTTRAIDRAIESLVRPRKRAGGDLCAR
jgi:hypothetical protein